VIDRREDLTDYYAASLYGSALVLEQDSNNVDTKWSITRARDLSYCVSTDFADYAMVRDTMAAAAQEWMDATKIASGDAPTVQFRHVSNEDGRCTDRNMNVFFSVMPMPEGGDWDDFNALSFFPDKDTDLERPDRTLLIHSQAFAPFGARTFQGLLRHEIGHMLGFRHEHINSTSLGCVEDDPATWRALTTYDVPSVMHYRNPTGPDCANAGTTDYTLTTYDNAGVRCLYTTQARASANTAGDACRALTSLAPAETTATASFVIDRDGQFYRLRQTTSGGNRTSTFARFRPPSTQRAQGWTELWSATEPVASATNAIFAGGGAQVYRRTPTTLSRWNGASWSTINGGPGSAIVVGYSSGDLFRLNTNGTIDRVASGGVAVSQILNTAVAGRKLFPGTTDLFRLESNGDLYRWTTAGWAARIGTGIKAAAKTDSGAIFALLNDAAGTVMLRNSAGAWNTIGSGASKIWGSLEVPYMSSIDNTATAADESLIISRNTAGSTWRRYALNSKSIMKAVGGSRRIAINANNRPYAYATP
jgi:serralysin